MISIGRFTPLGRILPLAVSTVVGIAGCIPLVGSSQDTPPRVIQTAQSVLTVIPDRLDLGTLAPGQDAHAKLSLRNNGDKPIVVARVKTSCECVTLEPSEFQVDPQSTVTLDVQYDSSRDPDFLGGLGVNLTGEASSGTALFCVNVDLSVQDLNRREARP